MQAQGKKKSYFLAYVRKKSYLCGLKTGTEMNIPTNPEMMVSFFNMKLRDEYGSLAELCKDLDINEAELRQQMQQAGYAYSEEGRRFW